MTHLDHFREIFPSNRLAPSKGELRYIFKGMDAAEIYERVAGRVIKKSKLALTADMEIWESGGYVREIALVVKPVPDPDDIQWAFSFDEAQDCEGLDGGWFGQTIEE